MDESSFPQPTLEQLTAFNQGDPLAKDDIARLVIPALYRWAVQHYANLPQDEVESTVHQVLAEICLHHERYNPHFAKFTTYVINLLKKRLDGLYQQWKKIKDSEDDSSEAQEKLPKQVYNPLETLDITSRIAREQLFNAVAAQLQGLEKEFLALMREGEKDLDSFVQVLRRYEPIEDPEHQVKNLKAKIMRQLKANAIKHGYQLEDLLGE